jgi:hypothetical protein
MAIQEANAAVIGEITDAGSFLRAMALPAAKKLQQLMDFAEKEETQLRAADSILDRGGFSREAKIKSETLHMTPSDVEAIAAAMVESARIRSEFSDHVEGFQAEETKLELVKAQAALPRSQPCAAKAAASEPRGAAVEGGGGLSDAG